MRGNSQTLIGIGAAVTVAVPPNIPINIAEIGSDEITHEYDLILKDEVVKRFRDPQTGQIGCGAQEQLRLENPHDTGNGPRC
jgi:hypothetical protein